RHEVEAGAAVLGRDHRAQQAQLGHALDDAHVEVMVDVVFLRNGQDPAVDELTHRLLDGELLVGAVEIQKGTPWERVCGNPSGSYAEGCWRRVRSGRPGRRRRAVAWRRTWRRRRRGRAWRRRGRRPGTRPRRS